MDSIETSSFPYPSPPSRAEAEAQGVQARYATETGNVDEEDSLGIAYSLQYHCLDTYLDLKNRFNFRPEALINYMVKSSHKSRGWLIERTFFRLFVFLVHRKMIFISIWNLQRELNKSSKLSISSSSRDIFFTHFHLPRTFSVQFRLYHETNFLIRI